MARSYRRPKIKQVSKWPSRQEQLSLLLGQILSPGAVLAGQLIGMGGALASQIKQRVEELEKAAPPAGEAAAPAGEAAAPVAAKPRRPRRTRQMLRRRVERRSCDPECIEFEPYQPFPPSNIIRPKRIDLAPRPNCRSMAPQ